MTEQKTDINAAFGIPADVEARLRQQAEAAASQIDEAALLKKFTEEATAKRIAELRAKAADAAEAAPEPMKSIDAHGFPKKYRKIVLYEGQGKQDLPYVPVGVNGFAWRLQTGKEIIVPSVVTDTLDAAIEDVTIQSEGGLVTRPKHRFPYQFKGDATEAEYNAFMEKMRAGSGPVQVMA